MKNNWQVKRLEEVTDIYSGGTPRRSIPEYWGEDVPWLTMEDTNSFDVRGTAQHISSEGLQNSNAQLVPAGSVNLSCTASVGNVTINRIPLATNQQFNSFHPHKELVTEFLAYQLIHRKRDIEALGGTTTFSFINKTAISNFKIQVPPIDTQKKIANILSSVDEAIQKTDQIIQKTELLKQGLMRELFTKGFNSTQYKKTKFGLTAANFIIVKLGEIAYVTKLAGYEFTKFFNSYRTSGEVIVLRGLNIKNGDLDLSNIKTISKNISSKLPRSQLNKGDLIFSYVGTIGPIALITDNNKFHLGPNICKITPNKSLLSKYLYYYFCSDLIKNEIEKKISIGAQPSLSMEKIRTFEILIPRKLQDQIKIVDFFDSLRNQIIVQEERKEKLIILKIGLMQDIFNQKVVIPV